MAEVARRTGASEILAAGDSLLDADLLLAADRGWRPGHGELADSGWQAPHVTALEERGVAMRRGDRAGLHPRRRVPGPRKLTRTETKATTASTAAARTPLE